MSRNMSNQPLLRGRPIPPGWTSVSMSDWVSNWHKQDPASKHAHISKLVEIASLPDSESKSNSSSVRAQDQASRRVQAFHQLEMLSKSDALVYERWLPIAEHRRQREFENILAERQERSLQKTRSQETGHPLPRDRLQMAIMGQGRRYEDIPLTKPSDLTFITEQPGFLGPPPPYYNAFESACRQGPLAIVHSTVSDACMPTPAFLHHGLCLALKAGNVETARYLLASGAPIVRKTPEHILSAPVEQQIPLFELFIGHGWTTNTPSDYGAVLLPSVLSNHTLLKWFLNHGANPNLGAQQERRDGGSVANSCAALEESAYRGDVEAVRMLLDAGAVIQNGFPLHAAAGACPPGAFPHSVSAFPSKEFDSSRIPVMALLVERGADINQYQGPQKGNQVPNYAIVGAAMAGAIERVRWLLENGADHTKEGRGGAPWSMHQRWGARK
ncbi:hypothetical protein BDW62DRAFT_41209 [Aspergillus aurantiobrunneus]